MNRTRYPISYSPVKGLILRLILCPQRWSHVDVKGDTVKARMSWAFSTKFSRSNIVHVSHQKRVLLTAGVHGWRGRWLVNGASGPIVSIRLREPARGHVLGFPLRLTELMVSVDDADGLIAQLG